MKEKIKSNLRTIVMTGLFVLSFLFIVLHIIDECFNGVGQKIVDVFQIFIEIMAYGMLPGVFVSWTVDKSIQNMHKYNKNKEYLQNKSELKKLCINLPEIVNACVVDANINVENFHEPKICFVELYKLLKTSKNDFQLKYFAEQVMIIKSQCEKLLNLIDSDEDFLSKKVLQTEKENLEKLKSSCGNFYKTVKNDEKEWVCNYNFDAGKFAVAVQNCFGADKELNKYIEEYISDDFCE